MILPATILIHTRDPALYQRLAGYLQGLAETVLSENGATLEKACRQYNPSVLLLDLRTEEGREHIPRLIAASPQQIIIALGHPRSEPALKAETQGVYAVEQLHGDRVHLQGLVRRALTHLQVVQENQQLRSVTHRATTEARPASPRAERTDAPLSLRHFSAALRYFDDVDAMMEHIVEGLASAAMVSRAGLFVRIRDSESYRLLAGLNCLDETSRSQFAESDPFPRWLEMHTHLVTRATLDQVSDLGERTLLRRTLDLMGAEILAPLQAHGRILGWFFVGHRATGLPFAYGELEDLTSAADHISSALENALLYEEVARQKSMAETLLHALPTGVVAADENGIVRWFSGAAANLLNLTASQVIGRSVETLGSRLADQLRRAATGENQSFPEAWRDPLTRRSLVVQARPLGTPQRPLGAVALIQDLTAQQALQEKQDQLERTAFWTELAASMSHEIRNPLVAIKTFAQLLPERYQDEEFRTSFSELVSAEVDRLNSIIEQINDFAHPPSLKFHQVDVRDPIQRSINLAMPQGIRDGLHVETNLSPDLPPVWGDERALADCFAHLLRNAMEALAGRADGAIKLEARRTAADTPNVQVTIRDNGPGIPDPLRDKIFSPFCTTKPRGMGLGLPIVKRTVVDHNGRVDVQTNPSGTAVTILLPSTTPGDKA